MTYPTISRLIVPDGRSFHGAISHYKGDRYICIYHNSEEHRIASCFVRLRPDLHFEFVPNTHTENLGIHKFIDPRIIKYNEQYFLSLSELNGGPEKINLFLLDIGGGVTISKKITTFWHIHELIDYNIYSREKNWTPWQYENKFLYTYSLNPHRILQVDINSSNTVKLIASTYWKSDTWWDRKDWVGPKYRLNCPPVLLPNGTYLSVFHTMCIGHLVTPWHKVQPNLLSSYYTGFYQFEGTYPFKVINISAMPFMVPDYILPENWPFHPPPSGGNPFYPFNMMLINGKIVLTGGSNEIAIAYCSIPLEEIISNLVPVINE